MATEDVGPVIKYIDDKGGKATLKDLVAWVFEPKSDEETNTRAGASRIAVYNWLCAKWDDPTSPKMRALRASLEQAATDRAELGGWKVKLFKPVVATGGKRQTNFASVAIRYEYKHVNPAQLKWHLYNPDDRKDKALKADQEHVTAFIGLGARKGRETEISSFRKNLSSGWHTARDEESDGAQFGKWVCSLDEVTVRPNADRSGIELLLLNDSGEESLSERLAVAWGEVAKEFIDFSIDCAADKPREPSEPGRQPMFQQNAEDPSFKTLRSFRQVVFYGPPGTGKTRRAEEIAKRLFKAESLQNNAQYQLVVFHPGFEYEQFMRGLRMEASVQNGASAGTSVPSLKIVEGRFLEMCWRALFLSYLHLAPENGSVGKVVEHTKVLADDAKGDGEAKVCLLVIDELNRGNVPALLGELVYALERDKRCSNVSLPYPMPREGEFVSALGGLGDPVSRRDFFNLMEDRGHKICVPHNLFVIGTMNTSDRSIGAIDAAVRRRFPFIYEGPDPQCIRNRWAEEGALTQGEQLAETLNRLNTLFRKEDERGEIRIGGFGHSYFLPDPNHRDKDGKVHAPCTCGTRVADGIRYFVMPLLREYVEMRIVNDVKNAASIIEKFNPDAPDLIKHFHDVVAKAVEKASNQAIGGQKPQVGEPTTKPQT